MLGSVLIDNDWRKTALVAGGIFLAGYVAPPLVFGAASGFAAFLQTLATVVCFVLSSAAIFAYLQLRSAGQADAMWVGEIAADAPADAPTLAGDVSTAVAPTAASAGQAPLSLSSLESLDEAGLRNVCTDFYRHKGFVCEAASGESHGLVLCKSAEPAFTAVLRVAASKSGVVQSEGIHELVEARANLGATKSFYVSLDGFSDRARTLAKGTQVTLIDGKLLLNMISRLSPLQQAQLQASLIAYGA